MNGLLHTIASTTMRKSLLIFVALWICNLVAMATTLSDQDDKVMTPFKFQPKQSEVITPQSKSSFSHFLKFQEVKQHLTPKGSFVTHSFKDLEVKNDHLSPSHSSIYTDEQTYTLTVNVNYDSEKISSNISGIAFPNYISDSHFYSTQYTSDKIEFTVPKGSYDIEVKLYTFLDDQIILTASDVDITEDKEIYLDTADATVEITWNPLMPDGTTPVMDKYIYDPITFEKLEEIPGDENIMDLSTTLVIFNKKHNSGWSILIFNKFWYSADLKSEIGLQKTLTMPNNDYSFYYVKRVITLDGGYLISLIANSTQSSVVTNDTNNYVTIKPEYVPTPYRPEPLIVGEDDNRKIYEFDRDKSYCLNYAPIINGTLENVSVSTLWNSEYYLKKWIHVCQDPKKINEFQVMPTPSLMEDWASNMDNYMLGLPINIGNDSLNVLGINNASSSTFYSVYSHSSDDTSGKINVSQATNPWLCFNVTKPHVWNYGCPAMVFTTTNTDWGRRFYFSYIGRLGEKRNIDILSTEAFISVDDAAASDKIIEGLQYGQLPTEGKLDFKFIDRNVEIDDVLGNNITRVCFDMTRVDWQPPTLQLVRFVDTKDNYTDRFVSGKDGVIEFYGGDFKFNEDTVSGTSWYTEEPATEVKVEYAPYGTTEFLPLEVENIPEKDFMPGFGTYYRGSLAGVDRKSANGWFDVRITLTDAAGNFQEQTFSPAFKIDENVGVESVYTAEIAVAIANGQIYVCGGENPIIEVYSPEGVLIKRVISSHTEVKELRHGIYLVNIIDGNRRVVRKVQI